MVITTPAEQKYFPLLTLKLPYTHFSHRRARVFQVIGLHPDQATEPIVDFALKNNKPFAVVPCCVFPNQYPNRRIMKNMKVRKEEGKHALGKYVPVASQSDEVYDETQSSASSGFTWEEISMPVRTHEDFCTYLAGKDPRIAVEKLDFEGRNTVIFLT